MDDSSLETLIPYLRVENAAAAIDFYAETFGAKELARITDPAGLIAHAELALGKLRLKLADELHDQYLLEPQSGAGNPVVLDLIVKDVDAQVEKLLSGGATLLNPITDKFYGYREAKLKDPFGHIWIIGTKLEDVSAEEMQRRADELYKNL